MPAKKARFRSNRFWSRWRLIVIRCFFSREFTTRFAEMGTTICEACPACCRRPNCCLAIFRVEAIPRPVGPAVFPLIRRSAITCRPVRRPAHVLVLWSLGLPFPIVLIPGRGCATRAAINQWLPSMIPVACSNDFTAGLKIASIWQAFSTMSERMCEKLRLTSALRIRLFSNSTCS